MSSADTHMFATYTNLCRCDASVMFVKVLLSGVSAQVHLALAAARDRRLVSSPAVLADGFAELGCSTL